MRDQYRVFAVLLRASSSDFNARFCVRNTRCRTHRSGIRSPRHRVRGYALTFSFFVCVRIDTSRWGYFADIGNDLTHIVDSSLNSHRMLAASIEPRRWMEVALHSPSADSADSVLIL